MYLFYTMYLTETKLYKNSKYIKYMDNFVRVVSNCLKDTFLQLSMKV